MAEVLHGVHKTTGKRYAIKRPLVSLGSESYLYHALEREHAILKALHPHPAIPEPLGLFVDEQGRPSLVMSFALGEPLDRIIEQEGALAWPLCRVILMQIEDAVSHAHHHLIIHRDLKPGNILIDRSGAELRLTLLDFGIAVSERESSAKPATGVYTPGYGAPEQLGQAVRVLAARSGQRVSTNVSPATDIWALGLLALELFTSVPASDYWGLPPDALASHLAVGMFHPPTARVGARAALLPAGFDAWFSRCVCRDVSARWFTFRQATRELLRLMDSTTFTRTASPTPRQRDLGQVFPSIVGLLGWGSVDKIRR